MTIIMEDKRIRQISMFSTNEEDIVLMFATHLRIKDSNGRFVVHWIYNRELKTNMRNRCQLDPDANVEDWVRFFLKNPSQPLASELLSAFLEKIGARSAGNVCNKSSKFLDDKQLRYYWRDLHQIACCISRDPNDFFRSFKLQRSLERYVYKRMKGKIIEEFFRILARPKWRSKWGLLKRTSRKIIEEALRTQYREPYLKDCLLAYDCFKRIYASQRPTHNGFLPDPTDEQWQQIVNLYNQKQSSSQAKKERIEGLLDQCVEAIRWYETRHTKHAISLDSIEEEENSHPSSETILDDGVEFLWEQSMMHKSIPGLTAFLTELLARIDEDTSNCLLLRYGFDLGYRSSAPIFKNNYTTVHYRDNKATQKLLKQVAQWAQENLNVTPDSESLNEMSALLKECLKKYYKNLIFESVFQKKWQQLDCKSQNILYLYYLEQEDVAAIASQLQLGESEVSKELVTGKQELAAAIREWTQNHLNISPDLLDPLADNIAALVQKLIVNFIASDSN